MDIIIDTVGQDALLNKDCLVESEDDADFSDSGAQDTFDTFNIEKEFLKSEDSKKKSKVNVTKDFNLENFERQMGWLNPSKKLHKRAAAIEQLKKQVNPLHKVLEKSAITPGFEQLDAVPPYIESAKQLKRKRQKERAKTTGEGWFNMRAPEMTPEVRHDLEVIKMRAALDPKHFYKKNDRGEALPKHFHIGKVVDTPLDYYSSRMTKKERKKTIVDELMADAEFSKYNKRKYKEIIDEKKKLHYKAHRHAKRLKGKKGKKK